MKLRRSIHFLSVEKITFIYIVITSIFLIFFRIYVNSIPSLFYNRLIIFAVIFGLAYLNSILDLKIIRFLRYAFIGGLLSYWYPETFEFNRFLPNCDFLLAHWEQSVFGFQPALVFSQVYFQGWICELMNMGYFAYYPMIILTSLYFFLKDRKYFHKFYFSIIFSFFVFYVIFILFPTAGPQYYFSVIGVGNVNAAIFPHIGDYFNTHQVTLQQGSLSGFFQQLVEGTQEIGEQPTAAFPSSHVGISTLIMILIVRNRRYLMAGILFPFYFLLVLATVYIQAHYLIDSIAGFVSAFILYGLSFKVYELFALRLVEVPIFINSPDE